MDLQELMRIGSLTMNFLQSDHFKQLMGMMGQMGGSGFGQPNANPGTNPNTNPSSPVPEDNANSWSNQANPFGMMQNLFTNPLSSLFGSNKKGAQGQTNPFPFSNQAIPPWMTQRPNVNPFQNHTMLPNQANKRPAPFGGIFNLFSPKQKQPQQNMGPWMQPFMGTSNSFPKTARNPQGSYMQASRVEPSSILRSEKNRIRIQDETIVQSNRARRKNKSRKNDGKSIRR